MHRLIQVALPAAMLGFLVLFTSSALSCEKHINGHQNGTDTNVEGSSN